MKIHFCDLCNESVPQVDLDQGRAFIRKDRVICAACDRAMSHHLPGAAEAPPSAHATTTANIGESAARDASAASSARADTRPLATSGVASNIENASLASAPALPSSNFAPPANFATSPAPSASEKPRNGAMWVAVLGLLFTAGAIFVIDNRLQVADDRYAALAQLTEKQATSIKNVEHGVALANDAERELSRGITARLDLDKSRRDSMAEELAVVKTTQTDIEARLAELTLGLKALQDKSGSGEFDLEKRFAELSAKIAKNEDALRALSEKVQVIESTPAPVVEPAVAEAPKPSEPAWKALLPDLQSQVNTLRWSAVDSLGASKDLEVVPHVVPMLKDADVFVRMAAARVLGDLGAKSAVGPLIDALEDGETAVREAAFVALRTITGKDLKFDPLATSEAERARRIKAWRDWWKKESESTPQ